MIALWTLLAACGLALFGGAHVVLLVGLVRRHGARALLAVLLPPLAPWWAWDDGRKKTCAAWGAGLVLYAIVIALA